jgi:hypothetical protein
VVRTTAIEVVHKHDEQAWCASIPRHRDRMYRYRLYASESARLLGEHAGYDAALRAADEHCLAVLASADDWVTVDSWIVGPGVDGPLTVHPVSTHIGPPGDLEGARQWLARVRNHARDECL